MENPEEVLQALDEFQKMRPSEIPRELEDYLCWVARTGDPVYQWGLIKALFREKLTRVMSEFYESCPSLDLAPCPNVEQFNYDSMKRNLLERLESFANAPFTVQRICELLTTPRKEYNRIDKFMRAIEKNILVVSTREPGPPFGRRSENGDSLVNGSLEDEQHHEQRHTPEVEMDSWVKDCAATTAIPAVHATDAVEDMSVENGIASSTASFKPSFVKQHDRVEQLPALDTSSFVGGTDFATTATTAVVAPQSSEPAAATLVENLTTANHEAAASIVGDVSDAIMNEDTSLQPSLELESDDNDSSDSKKLQTTFQAKDFSIDEEKAKTYSEVENVEKSDESIANIESSKECDPAVQSTYSDEKLLSESTSDSQSSDKIDNLIDQSVVSEPADRVDEKLTAEVQISDKSESKSEACADNFTNNLDTKKDEAENNVAEFSESSNEETTCDTDVRSESKVEQIINENVTDDTNSSESSTEKSSDETETLKEIRKPVIEESRLETPDPSLAQKVEKAELTIEETTEGDTKSSKTLVPDPIPIIEEPKDTESVTKDWDSSVLVSDVTSESIDIASAVKNGLDESSLNSDRAETDQMIIGCKETPSSKIVTEFMDVDSESLPSAQRDEPMELETTEAINS